MPPSAYHLAMERRALSADQNVLMTHLVVWLLALVSGILLGLRLFTKWLRAQQLWSDDGFLIASWVSHTRPCPHSLVGLNQTEIRLTTNQKFQGRRHLLLSNHIPRAGPGGRPPPDLIPSRGPVGAPPAGQRRPQPGPDGGGVEQDVPRLHAAPPAVAAPGPRRAVLGGRLCQHGPRRRGHRALAAVQADRRGLGQRRGGVLEH